MKKVLLLLTVAASLTCISFKVLDDQPKKPWVVPDKNANMKNPVASNSESISNGKSVWEMQCKSCHGKKGMGDGPKAAQLKTEPGDFSLASTQNQSDGSLFYKISEGRGDMPSFKKKISDPNDIWSVINYVRTFKK